jgi:hypothetical protein
MPASPAKGVACPAEELMRRGGCCACASRSRNGRFAFEFEFRGGFERSVERVLPGPLYTQKRGRRWFFTLLLAFCFGFRNLRE